MIEELYLQGNVSSSSNNDVICHSMASGHVHNEGNDDQNNWYSCDQGEMHIHQVSLHTSKKLVLQLFINLMEEMELGMTQKG